MDWDKDMSLTALRWMKDLGDFGPTVHPKERELKGWMADPEEGGRSKTYWTSNDLRELAGVCIEVANWLDKRAGVA